MGFYDNSRVVFEFSRDDLMSQHGIALFGGSFNPIHHGHLIIARAVAESLGLDRVVLVPSANPPHKSDHGLADASDRLAMARLAVADEPGLEVDDIEIGRTGPSYSILTVEDYRKQLRDGGDIFWIIGADTLVELHTWYRAREMVDLCRIVTAVRSGYETPDLSVLEPVLTADQVARLKEGVIQTPRIDISATDIRRRIAAGLSIRYLVPDSVQDYILKQELYRQSAGDSGRCNGKSGSCGPFSSK